MAQENKNLKGVIFVLLALLGILAAGIMVKRSLEIRKGAFYGKVGMLLSSVDPSEPNPNEITICGSETKTVVLMVDPSNSSDPQNPFKITAAELIFSYDKEVLDIDSVSFHDKYLASIWSKSSDGGTLKITALSLEKDLPREPFALFKVYLKSVANSGSTSFKLVSENYKVVGTRGNDDPNLDRTLEISNPDSVKIDVVTLPEDQCGEGVSVTPTIPPGTVTPTIPPSGGTNPLLKFKVSFGGVTNQIADQRVKLRIKGENLDKTYENILVQFNNSGLASGEVQLTGVSFKQGDKFLFFVKGPKHLARKFCQDGQTERCDPANLGLELSRSPAGVSYDWSKMSLEPGDINQDGKVDTADFSILKGQLGQEGENLSGDLDFNGVVNGRDIVLFLGTLSSKYEEDI